MQNGPDFDKFIEPFIEIYQNVELDIIKHIASHFKLYEPLGFKNSMEWYAKKAEELGGLTQEAIRIISRETKIPKKKIIKMLKEVGISTIDNETIDKLNDSRNFKMNINKLKSSESFLNIVENSYREIDGIFKLINTKAIDGANQAYMDVLNKAYISVKSGAFDYNTAIRKALTEMATKGIKVASYKQKNGKVINYSIESCVRRDVLTAVVQCTNKASENFAKEMKAEYYEVSQHLGARDTGTHDYKDHSWWQGKILKIDGSTKEYPNFQKTCNEGDVQGIGGANCRHIKWPFWPGISVPKKIKISPEENKRLYELSQAQRGYERTIRDYKRHIEVAKASNDSEKYESYKNKLKKIDKEYNQFCKDNDLKRKFSREDTSFVFAKNSSKESYQNVTQEWLENANPNDHQVLDANYFISNKEKYIVDNKNVVLDYSKKEKEVAEWLENTFGGELYMLPRINNPSGIETADYLFRKEYWDLKEINGNGKHTLDSAIKKKKSQANNFIFDLSNSKMTNDEAIRQLDLIFNSKDRKWLEKIILKRDKNVIVILKHKKRD